jgi:predicted PurR-regulated permease PerM
MKGLLGYLRVQFLYSLITLLLSWVCFQSFGFEYAMLIGVIAALLELIPQFGCGTLYLPWAVISFIVGQSRNGWIVLGLYLVYQLIRRGTEPMLLGSNLGVSPLLSLIGMFAGMQLAGVVGLILGPVAMVILSSAVRAHLFDGIAADCRTLSRYMKRRWKRGREGAPDASE